MMKRPKDVHLEIMLKAFQNSVGFCLPDHYARSMMPALAHKGYFVHDELPEITTMTVPTSSGEKTFKASGVYRLTRTGRRICMTVTSSQFGQRTVPDGFKLMLAPKGKRNEIQEWCFNHNVCAQYRGRSVQFSPHVRDTYYVEEENEILFKLRWEV